MKVGIPKGLLYCRYHSFVETFFYELGAELVISPDTNKAILDKGVQLCIDEACLPVKVFHGHVAAIKDQCDLLLLPRIMQFRKREYICPKFCGLPEMVLNTIPDMPNAFTDPIYAYNEKKLYEWASWIGELITDEQDAIGKAFDKALAVQKEHVGGYNQSGFKLKIALAGHPYNLYDDFLNMNLVKKLNKHDVGVLTEEHIDEALIDKEVESLFKKPFWLFARKSYGFLSHAAAHKLVDGIIYVSSFACGIDSVVVELIKDRIGEMPFMVLKIDEHTGEAGFETRIEAFVDMLHFYHA